MPTSRLTANTVAGIDTGRRGINREFADRNFDAACALIAESENRFVVGHDDQFYLAAPRGPAQRRGHRSGCIRGDPDTPSPLKHMAESHGGEPDGRRINNRQQRFEVLAQ